MNMFKRVSCLQSAPRLCADQAPACRDLREKNKRSWFFLTWVLVGGSGFPPTGAHVIFSKLFISHGYVPRSCRHAFSGSEKAGEQAKNIAGSFRRQEPGVELSVRFGSAAILD